MFKLMIKTHSVTGLKYLCSTKSEGRAFEQYCGSGAAWKDHLREHGRSINTEIIFEASDYDEFQSYCLLKSDEFDVVNSSAWANLIPESGCGTKGRTTTQRHKISEANRGKLRPDLAERNRSGMTDEIKQKISQTRSGKYGGENSSRFGVKHSDETRAKMAANRKGKGTAPKTEETKAKMREARLKYWATKKAS